MVLVALNNARKSSRITKRTADLLQISKALELYYNDNNSYPTTNGGYRSECSTWGSLANDSVIMDSNTGVKLIPKYLPTMPRDPVQTGVYNNCFIYRSNGTDYKIMDYTITDESDAEILSSTYSDPFWNGPGSGCPTPNPSNNHTLSISTPGARCAW